MGEQRRGGVWLWWRTLVFALGLLSGFAVCVGPAEGESQCLGPDAYVIGEAVVVAADSVTFRVVSIADTVDRIDRSRWIDVYGWIVPGEELDVTYPAGDGDLLEVGARYLVEVSGDPPVESSVPDRHSYCLRATLRPDGRVVHGPPVTVLDQVLRAGPVVAGAALAIWGARRWRDRRMRRRGSARAGEALASGELVLSLPGLPHVERPDGGDRAEVADSAPGPAHGSPPGGEASIPT